MATVNKDLISETAEVLLNQIKTAAAQTELSSALKELAEAFALVAERDPRSAQRTGSFA